VSALRHEQNECNSTQIFRDAAFSLDSVLHRPSQSQRPVLGGRGRAVREIGTWAMSGLLALLPAGVAGAGDVPDLVEAVELIKGYDRDDGAIRPDIEEPYFVEFCVSGVIAEPPVGMASVKRPGGFFDEPIFLPECLEFNFETQQDLDNAFPSSGGTYEFKFSKAGFAADSMNVVFDAPVPQGFADIQSPANGATDVDPDADVDVSWSIDPAGCFPSSGIDDCGDGVQVFVVDPILAIDVFESTDLPIDTTQEMVPAGLLEPLTLYDLELEVFAGELGIDLATSGGDPVSVKTVYKDINNTSFTTTVPEPGGALLGFVGLGAAGLLSRRRRAVRSVRGTS
jgi:MYXO-CTERM domain-containing protein